MFSQIQHITDDRNQCHAILDCFDVRYIVYFDCTADNVAINTYIVHSDRGGLIRRDCLPLFSPLFFWGGQLTIEYVKG